MEGVLFIKAYETSIEEKLIALPYGRQALSIDLIPGTCRYIETTEHQL